MGIRDTIQKGALTAISVAGDWATDTLLKADSPDADGDKSERAPGGTDEDDAASNPVPVEKAKDDPKSLFWDPFAIVEQLGYKDKPSAISYGTLRAILYRMPIVYAIVQTRINQVASFCTPQHDRYQLGFRIKLRDSGKEPTPEERKWIQQMESVITRTGVTDNPRGRDDFEDFLKKLTWDSLVYDQMTWEVVPNRKGQPAEWYATDATTMRLADTASTFVDEDDKEITRYVQIYDSMIIAEYTQDEMMFGVRNPRTDIKLHGYGTSELEMIVSTITALLYGIEYNTKFFTHGSAAKGIINFKGAIPERQLAGFRRQWYQMISGVENAWRTPITNAEELQWINMQQSSRDMEFPAWMDFLIKVACSAYSIDPVEVNFQYGNAGQKSSLMQQSNKEKITESKERGLRPLLRNIAKCINRSIIWPINEAFEFDFVGLDAHTRDGMADLNMKRVKTTHTVDELRAEDDMPPLPDGKGEIILDPTFLQNAMGGGEGPEGMPGEEGGEDEDEMDFEGMLSQYEDEEDEEDEREKEERDFGAKKKTEKSLPHRWSVEI